MHLIINQKYLELETQRYLGCGDPLMGFCPYFLHEKSSEGISADLLLNMGTRMVLLIRSFLS